MNDPQNHAEKLTTLEEGVNDLLCDAKKCIRVRYRQCEDRIRHSPIKAVVGALAAGYVLHRLPVRSILVTQVRVIAALTPPALLIFGVSRLYQYFRRPK